MGNFTQEGFKYCAPGNYTQWNTDKLFFLEQDNKKP